MIGIWVWRVPGPQGPPGADGSFSPDDRDLGLARHDDLGVE